MLQASRDPMPNDAASLLLGSLGDSVQKHRTLRPQVLVPQAPSAPTQPLLEQGPVSPCNSLVAPGETALLASNGVPRRRLEVIVRALHLHSRVQRGSHRRP